MDIVRNVYQRGYGNLTSNRVGNAKHHIVLDITLTMPGIYIRMGAINDKRVRFYSAHSAQKVQIGSNFPAAFDNRLIVFYLSGYQNVSPVAAFTNDCPCADAIFADAACYDQFA
nr:hypothetical protein [Sphingomonas paeninsulae]